MDLTTLLSPGSRVLEVGARGPELARHLAAAGHDRWLGLVAPAALDRVRAAAPEVADRVHPLDHGDQAVHHSTDLLVLRAPYARVLWSVLAQRHVSHVAVETGAGLPLEHRLARTVGRSAGRLQSLGVHTAGGSSFDVVQVARRPDQDAGHHLSPVWGVPGLVDRLDAAGVQYVVLRWFEDLPRLDPGQGLDVLVRDGDLPAVQAVLAEEPGTIPVALYSETGLPGSDLAGVACFPPPLARQLLERAVRHPSGVRVPAPQDHLRSLAYHAVYHQGGRSGLPSSLLGRTTRDPDHDYAGTLRALSRQTGVALPDTLEEVDAHLARDGWRPPPDTLRRLAEVNPWVAASLPPASVPTGEPPEVAVFLVRQQARTVLTLDEVLGVLDHFGFEPLAVRELDPAAQARCAGQLRGGNWGRGPFARSGGDPAVAVVVVHHGPVTPHRAVRRQQPRLSNLAVFHAKLAVRDLVEARLEPDERFNALHSSDNEPEAWEYVDVALPEEAAALRAEVEQRRADYRTDVPVVRVLSLGRRAKVEVVEGPAGRAVRKTFSVGYRRHLERELRAFAELAPHVPAIPELLETGPNWFTVPLYTDELARFWRRRRLLPLRVVNEMVAVLAQIHARGFDLVDARPQNFLVDPRRGMVVVDFEFLVRYEGEPPALVDSYCFVGLPEGWSGDVPVGELDYEERWRVRTGLSRPVLVAGPRWRQHLERTLFRLSPVSDPDAPGRRGARGARKGLRLAAERAAVGYGRWAQRRANSAITRD